MITLLQKQNWKVCLNDKNLFYDIQQNNFMYISITKEIYKVKKIIKLKYMRKIFIITLMLLSALVLGSCAKKKTEKIEAEKKIPLVKVKEIQGESFTEKFRVVGSLKPYASAKLSSEEGGIITFLNKDKGSRVYKGEVVVRLLKDQDNAMYEQALSQMNLAIDNFQRTERLYKEGVATEQQYTGAKLQLEAAEKSVDVYKVRLRKGYVSSPISGVVDAKMMNKGEMSAPGVPILSIIDVSRVKISAGIPERYLGELRLGQIIKITFDMFPDDEFNGSISYIAPALNPQTRTFEIEVVIQNRGGKLKPEMMANIEVSKKTLEDVIVLQQDLIIDNVTEQFVYVLENGIAKKRILKLGGRSGNDVVIEEGLNQGDMLIYEGFQGLKDGETIEVVK